MSNEYKRLHPIVQKWVFKQGWKDLRDIQKDAIEPILNGQKDIIISASTAAGKTEAFFLPACSAIADIDDGFGILYISPLKALINDQYRRLEELCQMLELQLTPWHGDSIQSKKLKAKKNPSGIILITPESLESLLIREAGWVQQAFKSLKYIVIDEFHAFIGTERGFHLISLLNRLDTLLQKNQKLIPRVALSATLGNLEEVSKLLRPTEALPCSIITSKLSQSTLQLKIFGYKETIPPPSEEDLNNTVEYEICLNLYNICRGDSHLIFANSRARTEKIAVILSELCKQNGVPNEFFPHHGSLSKELREELESRLQKESLPTTAVCTMTLELGIDIGKVNSVAQVTAPHSVSSLRQRLGRSGRRDNKSVLRVFISEREISSNSNIIDKLRLELLQSIAIIRLLIVERWFEPADIKPLHFSTLLHQILATIAQWGGIRAEQIYDILCINGPFSKITTDYFKQLLVKMGETRLITQLSSGELVLGIEGEKLVNYYTFYAVFKTPEEYRVIIENKTLGTLPVDSPMIIGQHMIFAGKRWRIIEINSEKKAIYVKSSKGGNPPKFSGNGINIHTKIRQEMFNIYFKGDYKIDMGNSKIDFLDDTARELFEEGLETFQNNKLDKELIVQQGKNVYILPWMGDIIVNTLVALLIKGDFKAGNFAGVIEVEDTQVNIVQGYIKKLVSNKTLSNSKLAQLIEDKIIDKFDHYLPDSLLTVGYGEKMFDIKSTMKWIQKNL